MTEALVKIRFELDGDQWHGHGAEEPDMCCV